MTAPGALSHQGRKHSRFSASGAERWFNCPGSVALSEGMPDKDSPWAKEGTRAHEVLENILTQAIEANTPPWTAHHRAMAKNEKEMVSYGVAAADFILGVKQKAPGSEIMVETRISLPFVHADMFGTFDAAVVNHFGTLHVFDYKYGAGHAVSPIENLQMIFYGIGLAHQFDWNFKTVRLWIIQPRIRGYDGPLFWDIPIARIKGYVSAFESAVEAVEKSPTVYREGQWCHWCKAKSKCPIKLEAKSKMAANVFATTVPLPKGA